MTKVRDPIHRVGATESEAIFIDVLHDPLIKLLKKSVATPLTHGLDGPKR